MKLTFDDEKISSDPMREAKKLESIVLKEFESLIYNKASMLLYFIQDCESPIERLLGMYLYHQEPTYRIWADDNYMLSSQFKIKLSSGSEYRLDFFIQARVNGVNRAISIECDGHEFHERTKEQVERDNKRTRDLQMAGITVVRFAGSEIVKSPAQCAREANMVLFGSLTYEEVQSE